MHEETTRTERLLDLAHDLFAGVVLVLFIGAVVYLTDLMTAPIPV